MQEIERFRLGTRILHWTVTTSALLLAITGILLWIPGAGAAAATGWSRLLHRIASVVFMASPIIYVILSPKMSWHFIKESFNWGKDDIGWLRAAPEYYFGGDESKMPPQGHINTGQKLWQLIAILCAVIFVVSGVFMWFFRDMLPTGVFSWAVIAHDVAFILGGAMLLVHVYLGSIHPRMTESFRSMITGRVSASYARSHYRKWYDEEATKASGKQESKAK
jgi:formate dehydrogenase subunit gamma